MANASLLWTAVGQPDIFETKNKTIWWTIWNPNKWIYDNIYLYSYRTLGSWISDRWVYLWRFSSYTKYKFCSANTLPHILQVHGKLVCHCCERASMAACEYINRVQICSYASLSWCYTVNAVHLWRLDIQTLYRVFENTLYINKRREVAKKKHNSEVIALKKGAKEKERVKENDSKSNLRVLCIFTSGMVATVSVMFMEQIALNSIVITFV